MNNRILSIRNSGLMKNGSSDFTRMFHDSYHSLGTAVTLCEGLEIIMANPAATRLIGELTPVVEGTLINVLFPDKNSMDLLFDREHGPVSIETCDHHLILTATRWQVNEQYWIIEWKDETLIRQLEGQLSIAQSLDSTTGTLLASCFSNRLRASLEICHASVLAHILVGNPALSDESINDAVTGLVDRISHEFGNTALIHRHNTNTLALYLDVETAQSDEHAHILRQLNLICSRFLAPHAPIIGLAVFPRDGDTECLLREASLLALDAAKTNQKPTMFTEDLRDAATRRTILAEDMNAALANNEIEAYFQPVFDSKTSKIKSFESLVRWTHPTHGYVIPPDIVQIAQDTGRLHALTSHILQNTIDEMANWPDDIQFAVNVTPSQLTGELVDLVRESVRSSGIDPERLEIEVTEEALIENFEYSATIFSRLRSIGVSMAMDDFGAGYTSISNLRKLKFDKIKVDKLISDGLPDDPRSVAIVKSIEFLCKELHVAMTVEGIEEQGQLDFLSAFDCGIQGYVFARPTPARDLSTMRKFLA